jgi:hypothetical protein
MADCARDSLNRSMSAAEISPKRLASKDLEDNISTAM